MVTLATKMRQPIPDAIRNAPVLLPGLELFFVAFYDLVGERPVTMGGVGPIPWRAIDQYCASNDLTGDLRADMFYHVRKLDAHMLEYAASKRKKEPGDGSVR